MSIQAGRTIKIIVVDDEPISADDNVRCNSG